VVRTVGLTVTSPAFGFAHVDLWNATPVAMEHRHRRPSAALTRRGHRRSCPGPENTVGRFFAWVHYLDPHSEYVHHQEAPDLGTGMAPPRREVWFTDHHLGRLFGFIAAQPWADRPRSC